MEGIRGPAAASGPHEAEVERTIQELTRRKRQLEDEVQQVCFKPGHAAWSPHC
jgi:hypothetical protein